MKPLHWRLSSAFFSFGFIASATHGHTAGFQLREFNASSLYSAHSGTAVTNGDVTSIFHNPANMASLDKHAVGASTNLVIPTFKFSKKSATFGVSNISGSSGGNGGGVSIIPAAYLVWHYNPKFNFGISATVPWGLKTQYEQGWVGRAHADRTELTTFNVAPMVSYKHNDEWAFGGGIQIQYAKAKLSNDLTPNPLLSGRPASIDMQADDWGVGLLFGTTYQPLKDLRFGLSYRGVVNHNLTGQALVNDPTNLRPTLNGGAGAQVVPSNGAGVRAKLMTPEVITLSGAYDLSHTLTIMSDLQWTRWNRVQEIKINYTDGTVTSLENLNWSNTLFYSAGMKWQPTPHWAFRWGVAYDETPTKSATRGPRIPDSDRFWISCGVEYQGFTTDHWEVGLSAGYSSIFFREAEINLSSTSKGNLRGDVSSHAHLVGVQAKVKL